MRARVAYILTMDEPARKELQALYLPTQKLPRQPDNAFENNVCALVLQSWPDLLHFPRQAAGRMGVRGALLSTAFFGVSLFKKKVTQCGPLNPGAA